MYIELFCFEMFLVGFVVITSAIFSLILWWYFIYFKYKKCLKMFSTPSQLPLLGITHKILNGVDIFRTIQSTIREMGKNVFVMIGPIPTLITADPKIFSTILGNSRHIHKPFVFRWALNTIIPNSLLSVNGAEWRRQRKLLNPTLDYKSVMNNITLFNKNSNNLIDTLKAETKNESTELVHIMEEFLFEQTIETLFDDVERDLNKKVILNSMKSLMDIITKKIFLPLTYLKITHIFTKIYWEEKGIIKIVNEAVKIFMEKKRKKHRNVLRSQRRPIHIDVLMSENNTDEFIGVQLKLGVAAAIDTTSITLSFALYALAKSPEIQQKAYEEIHSILGDDYQGITNQQISQMKYLNLIIKESMRLYPTVPMYLRTLQEDVKYEETVLPKGLMILLAPFMMHVDPDLYPEPEKFIPERFLRENLNMNRYSYAPFNLGVRNCIGQLYAMTSMKIALAKLLFNYEFVDVHHQLCLSVKLTTESITGVRVGIRKRNCMVEKSLRISQ